MADVGSRESSLRIRAILIATAIVAFGFIGSRLLGVLRTVAIADAFGSDPELGAWHVAFRVPDLIFQVLAGATLGSAFIPVFARVSRREGMDQAWRLASIMLNLVTAGTALLCLIAFALAPRLVPVLAPELGEDVGRADELTDQAVDLTRIMLLSPFLFAVSGMITGILNGRQQFFLPALAPMLYNLAIIFGALALSGPFGVEGLAVAVVGGAGLHLLVQVPGLVRERMRYSALLDWRDSAVREVGRLMAPRVVGLAAAQLNFVVTLYFASKVGTAEISDLNYAWLLAQLPLAVFGMAISTALFPSMADQIASGEGERMQEVVSQALRVIMFLTIPAALGLALLRVPVTTLVLERGEFTARDTVITAAAVGWYCLGIIPQAGIEIHSRAFYAMGDTRAPVILAVAAVGLNLALSGLLYTEYGHKGLAFSVSAAAWFEWLVLYRWYILRTGASARNDFGAMAVFSMCGAVMALFLVLTTAGMDGAGRADNVVIALAGAMAGGCVYIALARLVRVPELEAAFDAIRSRF
jgi:putative peptidoglycan lipid II flippase